jgi:hypothetical protein
MSSKFSCTAALCLAATAFAPDAAYADDAILVSLLNTDRSSLDAMKTADGVDWWVEAGEVMLLVGEDRDALSGAARASDVLDTFERVAIDELFLHARGCGDNTTPIDESLVIVRGGSYDLVRRPRSFSPGVSGDLPLSTARLGGPEWLPVQRNSTLARLHHFDRPDGVRGIDPRVSKVVDRVDGTRWFANVETLAGWDRSSFSTELTDARQWIAGEFATLGLTVSEPFFTFNFTGTPTTIANVIGRFEGVLHPDEWIIVGGHYDSRQENITNPANSPGADDNASGCSGVIEAAHAIVEDLPQRSVLFMCYSGEEQGLYGSEAHVESLQSSGDIARVKTMLNMDMIGWSADANLGVRIESVTGGPGTPNALLIDQLADAALLYAPALSPNLIQKITNTCCSDHMPYINAGIPGTMSIHRGSASAYPHYHRTTDTPANLGPHAQDIGNAIVRMNVAVLAQLAGTDRIFRGTNEP